MHTIRKAFIRSKQCGTSKGKRTLNQINSTTKRNKPPKSDGNGVSQASPVTSAHAGYTTAKIAEIHDFWTSVPKPGKDETLYIRTRLAHPILLDGKDEASCHWCQDVGYGILGLGPTVEVEILDMNDGEGYVEVSGGYLGAGMESSQMCIDCTMDRLEIAACLEHNVEDLKEIEGAASHSFDPNLVMDHLMPGMAASAPFTWCSVCPQPALYACCKPINKEVQAILGGKDDKVGCGLNLCQDCAEDLVHDVGGDLDALVRAIKRQDDHDLSLRADVELILRSGEVVRRMGGIFSLGPDLL